MTVATEPGSAVALTNSIGFGVLLGGYVFGVWIRKYILPTGSPSPLWRELLLAIPAGFVVLGGYAKITVPAVFADQSGSGVFDGAIAIGYAIFFGMLSRETLGKMLAGFGKNMPAVGPGGPSAVTP